jgi:hypothetical protein
VYLLDLSRATVKKWCEWDVYQQQMRTTLHMTTEALRKLGKVAHDTDTLIRAM